MLTLLLAVQLSTGMASPPAIVNLQRLLAESIEGKAVIAKLEAAIQQLDKGNPNQAINQLHAFVNQVNALISAGTLSSTEGQPLIDAANAIIALLGG